MILVTGAAGFLGRHCLEYLSSNASGRGLIAHGRLSVGRPMPGVTWTAGDLRSMTTWRDLPDDVHHVVHLAARIPAAAGPWDEAVIAENLAPIQCLLERARSWRLKSVVYSSSVSVYTPGSKALRESDEPRPWNAYGAAKLAGEALLGSLRAAGTRVAHLRFSSLYGPGQAGGSAIPAMVRSALERGEIEVFGEGRRKQDFLCVRDAARLLALCLERDADTILNAGSGTATSMRELADTIGEVIGAGRVQIRLRPELAEGSPGWLLDMGRTCRLAGFEPEYSLRCGLSWMLAAEKAENPG